MLLPKLLVRLGGRNAVAAFCGTCRFDVARRQRHSRHLVIHFVMALTIKCVKLSCHLLQNLVFLLLLVLVLPLLRFVRLILHLKRLAFLILDEDRILGGIRGATGVARRIYMACDLPLYYLTAVVRCHHWR